MTAPPIRILLVDDHAVVREGIQAVFGAHADFQVVGSVGSGEEALAAVEQTTPDVVILDLRMPGMDGLAVLEALRARHPRVKVVMLSGHSGDEAIWRALSGGAAGYLLKTAPAQAMVEGVRQAYQGRARPSAEVAGRLAERTFYGTLSDREIEVLRHAAGGQSNKEIAGALGVAESTVKNHLRSIMEKLQVDDRTEAVTVALRRGVIDLGE
jgi:two-component system, NarL family, response regulator